MRRLIAIGLAAALAGCGKPPELAARDGWIRLPAVPGRPAAAYLKIHGGAEKVTLLAVSTPAALRAELHESMKGDHGMMAMTPLPQVDVPPAADVAFAPGARHIMLFDVAPALTPGATAPLTLKFAEGKALTVTAKVVGPADPAP